jgi:hypothetical protein
MKYLLILLTVLLLSGCTELHVVKSTRLEVSVDTTCVLTATDNQRLRLRDAVSCQDFMVGDTVPSINWVQP